MSLPVPYRITEAWGTSAPNPADITLPVPVPDQTGVAANKASFETGFPPSTFTPVASGGLPPLGQDFNGLLWMITAHIACISAGKPYIYDATQSAAIGGYPVGAVLARADLTGFWLNQTAANTTDPDAGGAGWVPAFNFGYTQKNALTTGNTTLTARESAKPLLFFGGTLTGNVTITVPAITYQQWVCINNTSGAHTLTVIPVGGGTGILIPQTGSSAPTSIYSDGANLFNTGVSTAGLAPINSPALTGVPTGPTASAPTSTTQLATTAFAHAAITAALAGYALLASPTFSGNPTAPTQPATDNTLKLATTAFVQAHGPTIRSGTFACVAGVVSVSFGFTFAAVPKVFVQWNYTTPDVGWVVPGSITTTGFQYQNGNAGTCDWLAAA